MRRAFPGCAALLLAVVAMLGGAARASAPAATALDRYLEGLSTWSAEFTQVVVDSRGRKAAGGTGRLVIVRPGRFRWEITPQDGAEAGQLLVADGRNLWFLDRDLEQVTVRPQGAAIAQSPAMLLAGTAQVRDGFDVAADGRGEGLEWVRVRPRQPDAEFRSARFGFRGAELERLVVEDRLGQKTTLAFTGGARNRSVDPALVAFTVPAGVDVIGKPAP